AAEDPLLVGLAELSGPDSAHAGGHGHVAAEDEPLDPERARRQFHDPVIRDAAAGIGEDAGRVAEGLDRPLPIAAAADVAADELGLGVAAAQLRELPAVRDPGLLLDRVMRMPGVVEDRHAQLDRQLDNREDDRLGASIFIIELDADESVLVDT